MFQSFFMGGFECSTHRLRTGKRLNVTAATGHDKFAAADYQRLQQQGIHSPRRHLLALNRTVPRKIRFFQRPANNPRRPRHQNAGNLGFVSLRLARRY